jgi:hypothetical protein
MLAMSLLSKLLKALEPVDEDILKKIVQAVDLAPDKLDLTALGADLAVPRASAVWPREMSTSRKIPPSEQRKHAKTIRTHAEKLFSALSSTDEVDARFEFWRLISSRQQDEGLKALSEFLLFLRLLIRDADQIISAADAEIQTIKVRKKRLVSTPPSLALGSFHSPPSASWIIAWELAPIFEKHFRKKATTSTPSEAHDDRTPRGPFVQFVQAVQQQLNLFPSEENLVSPQTIATALARTKSQRAERALRDTCVRDLLQGK